LRYICLEGLSTTTKILKEDCRYSGRNATKKIVQYIYICVYAYIYTVYIYIQYIYILCKGVWMNRLGPMDRQTYE
jgi:hypothetical protein